MYSEKNLQNVMLFKFHLWFWNSKFAPIKLVHHNTSLEIVENIVYDYFDYCDEVIVASIQSEVTLNTFEVNNSSDRPKLLLVWFRDITSSTDFAICLSRIEEYLQQSKNFEFVKFVISGEKLFTLDDEFDEYLMKKYNNSIKDSLIYDFLDRRYRCDIQIRRHVYNLKREILSDLSECSFRIDFLDKKSERYSYLFNEVYKLNKTIPEVFSSDVASLIQFHNKVKNLYRLADPELAYISQFFF